MTPPERVTVLICAEPRCDKPVELPYEPCCKNYDHARLDAEPVEYVPASQLEQVEKERNELVAALSFYAEPETYFAIGFLPDAPCGDFIEDFEDVPGFGSAKPGKRARAALDSRA